MVDIINKRFVYYERLSSIQVPETLIGDHVIEYSGYLHQFGPFYYKGSSLPVRDIGYKSYVQTDKPVYKPGQPVRLVK